MAWTLDGTIKIDYMCVCDQHGLADNSLTETHMPLHFIVIVAHKSLHFTFDVESNSQVSPVREQENEH